MQGKYLVITSAHPRNESSWHFERADSGTQGIGRASKNTSPERIGVVLRVSGGTGG
jgi:hypothetical protein